MPIAIRQPIGQEQPVETILGDDFFIGLDQQHDPGVVQPGFYSKGENVRVEDGVVRSRGGHFALNWTFDATIASEELTNGTFATDSNWTKGDGWTIGSGVATSDGTQSARSALLQSILGLATSEIYKLEYDITTVSAGTIRSLLTTNKEGLTGANQSTVGHYVDYFAVADTLISFAFDADADFTGSIDNASLKAYNKTLGATFGASRFSNPGAVEFIMVAGASEAWILKQGNNVTTIPYPSGVTIGENVEFIQAFDLLFMLRGTDKAPLMWPGGPADAFVAIDQSDPGGGFLPFPSAGTGTYFHNRLCLIRDRDSIIVSDIFDETKFSIFNDLFVNRGSDDSLVAIHPIGNQTLVAFKDQSIFLIGNFIGDLSTLRLDDLTRSVGLKAKDSLVSIGDSIYFLSDQGIYVVRQALDSNNRLKAVAQPLSDPIQPLIDRINWNAAAGATAAFVKDRIYFAVPIDGSAENNAVLVYRFAREGDDRGAWESLDIWSNARYNVRKFVLADYIGQKRLIAIAYDGYAFAYSYLYDGTDTVDPFDINTMTSKWRSRGYSGGDGLHNRTTHAYLQLETWNPTYSVSAFSDGANEEQILITARTKNRLKYIDQGSFSRGVWTQQADYVPTNTNDDHATAGREDYSVDLDTTGGFDLSVTGANFNQSQEIQEPLRINRFGRYVQLEAKNTTGNLGIHSIRVGQRSPVKRNVSVA